MLGLQGIAIAVVVTALFVGAATMRVMSRLCDADKAWSEVASLKGQLKVQRDAAASEKAERERIASRNEELQTKVADYEGKLENVPAAGGTCDFRDAPAARRLRNIK